MVDGVEGDGVNRLGAISVVQRRDDKSTGVNGSEGRKGPEVGQRLIASCNSKKCCLTPHCCTPPKSKERQGHNSE